MFGSEEVVISCLCELAAQVRAIFVNGAYAKCCQQQKEGKGTSWTEGKGMSRK